MAGKEDPEMHDEPELYIQLYRTQHGCSIRPPGVQVDESGRIVFLRRSHTSVELNINALRIDCGFVHS